jgi:hypothetical protein
MAGTARRYSTAEVIKGPVDIWLDVAAPAAGAEATIDTTSNVHTPDATASPSAIHLGMTKGGLSVLMRPSTANSDSDEISAPYRSILSAEEIVLSPKGSLQFSGGASRLALANKLLLGSTASTPSGKRKLTGGGLSTITFMTVLAIWASAEDASKYEYIMLYRSFNDAGLAFDLSRLTDASSDLAFRGFSDVSRAAGDQIYQWVIKT